MIFNRKNAEKINNKECTINDFLNKFIFLRNKSNIQIRAPVIIGVIRYKYDKSCLVKLFKNSESLKDLDRINNATIKNE